MTLRDDHLKIVDWCRRWKQVIVTDNGAGTDMDAFLVMRKADEYLSCMATGHGPGPQSYRDIALGVIFPVCAVLQPDEVHVTTEAHMRIGPFEGKTPAEVMAEQGGLPAGTYKQGFEEGKPHHYECVVTVSFGVDGENVSTTDTYRYKGRKVEFFPPAWGEEELGFAQDLFVDGALSDGVRQAMSQDAIAGIDEIRAHVKEKHVGASEEWLRNQLASQFVETALGQPTRIGTLADVLPWVPSTIHHQRGGRR